MHHAPAKVESHSQGRQLEVIVAKACLEERRYDGEGVVEARAGLDETACCKAQPPVYLHHGC